MRVSKINQSTIISLATPGGKSALAIVRCSGPKVKEIIKKFFPTLNKKLPEPNKSKYLEMTLRGNNLEEIIDDVVIIYYVAGVLCEPVSEIFGGTNVHANVKSCNTIALQLKRTNVQRVPGLGSQSTLATNYI